MAVSSDQLRIAIVSGIDWRTPPRHAASRESIAADLADGLVAKGMDVTLFATADSKSKARLRAICPRPLLEDSALDPAVWNLLHLADAFAQAHEYDVIHCFGDVAALAYAEMVDTPVILTLHETPSARQLPIFHKYSKRATYIAVSDFSRLPGIPYKSTISPGIPLEDYKLSNTLGEYLLFVGQIGSNRGIEEVIEIASLLNLPVVVGGPIADRGYFETKIHPLAEIGKLIYLGPISRERRNEIYGNALALIHLSERPDAFRLTMIEAMACGTPVITRRIGANSEIVENRKTGFLVSTQEEIIEAISQIRLLDRRKVRQRVIDHFSQNGMTTQYLRIYESAITRAQEQIRKEDELLQNRFGK